MDPIRSRRRALLAWFDRHKRDLPWRRTRDPYAIWISETMLQQTRVETAIPYYQRFLERFPTARELAAAEASEVLSLWAGLGYYRRARMLQLAAQSVVAEHGGELPATPDALASLPGVGSYTSGAVASIAFGARVPAVDGNVLRVLSRWHALRGDPRESNTKKTIEASARAHVEAGDRAGDWNQSLMELGATVCLPRRPLCLACPVRPHCEASARGLTEKIPAARKRRATVRVRHAAALVERRGALLMSRRPEGERMAGLLELPTVELAASEDPRARLVEHVRETTGFALEVGSPFAEIHHSITHHRIELLAFAALETRGRGKRSATWLTPESARLNGVTAATRKILDRWAARATRRPNPTKT